MAKELEKKSLKELYDERKNEPTPAQKFIMEVAELTDRSEQTVKMWLCGAQIPDTNVARTIANHFGVESDSLFPSNE